MVPIPYRAAVEVRTTEAGEPTTCRCPTCGGDRLRLANGSWSCGDCGHVPSHGAD